MEEKKMTKSKIYMIVGICLLVLAIGGSTYAYYAASRTAEISGYAAGAGMEITVTPLSTTANEGNLIPLDNDIETLNKATLGYGNTTGYDATKACIDINGYSACKTYEITVTNTGNAPLTVNGGVSLFGANTPNIDCAVMTDEVTVESNASCKGKTTLADGVTIDAHDSKTYYIVVYIENINEEQNDSGAFSGTITFTSTVGGKLKAKFAADPETVNIAEYITNLYTTNIDTQNPVTNNEIQYYYAPSVSLMNDRLGGTETFESGKGNIRYYGASPNNYIDIGDTYKEDFEIKNWVFPLYLITEMPAELLESEYGITDSASCLSVINSGEFGSEDELLDAFGMTVNEICSTTTIHVGDPILYRIVGIFNGKVKLIRDESIGVYSWDTSDSSVNDGDGINQWGPSTYISDSSPYEGADLMRLLNPGFTGIGGSLWYNGTIGECYTGPNNEISTCDFRKIGLNNQVKPLIADDTWYLGGWDDFYIYVNEIYGYERGENVCGKNGIECVYSDDGIQRQTTWTGKIGLMYPSDFGYAVDFNSCTEDLCDYNESECAFSNWLAGIGEWMITPSSSSGDQAWYATIYRNIYNDGYVGYDEGGTARPVFSLISNAEMEVHAGTSSDPYVLSLS